VVYRYLDFPTNFMCNLTQVGINMLIVSVIEGLVAFLLIQEHQPELKVDFFIYCIT